MVCTILMRAAIQFLVAVIVAAVAADGGTVALAIDFKADDCLLSGTLL